MCIPHPQLITNSGGSGWLFSVSDFMAHDGTEPGEELPCRLAALSHQLRVLRQQCSSLASPDAGRAQAEAAVDRMATAWCALAGGTGAREGEAAPPPCSYAVELDDSVLPEGAAYRTTKGPALLQGASRSSCASFGGPWLPRAPEESREERGAEGGTSAEEQLRSRLAACRVDRRRYFEQYLECRELIVAADRCKRRDSSSSSAPAATASRHPPALPPASRGRAASRGLLAPVATARATPAQRSGSGQGREPLPRSARGSQRWSRFWEELSGGGGGGAAAPREEERPGLRPAPINMGGAPAPPSEARQVPQGMGGGHSLLAHLEDRALIEKEICFWEHECLGLCARERELQRLVSRLHAERAIRRELEEAAVEVLALLAAGSGMAGRAPEPTSALRA